jgi:ABC-type sugar transport system ATPase subunit
MEGICKSFPGVRALDNVDFLLRKGEIHALMGENGAGKSTLIKVITGFTKRTPVGLLSMESRFTSSRRRKRKTQG